MINLKKIRFNVVDILIVCLIILAIIAVKVRFKKYNSADGTSSQGQKIAYEMVFNGVRQFTVDAFEVGDTVFDNLTGVEIGHITSKNTIPAETFVNMQDGSILKSTMADKWDLCIGIETDGLVSDSAYYANKTVELKVGSDKTIDTKYAKSSGKISKIQVIETK